MSVRHQQESFNIECSGFSVTPDPPQANEPVTIAVEFTLTNTSTFGLFGEVAATAAGQTGTKEFFVEAGQTVTESMSITVTFPEGGDYEPVVEVVNQRSPAV